MKQHQYRITIEHLADATGRPVGRAPYSFEIGNHDDLLQIVEHMQARAQFAPDTAAALALGIKLFSEVMLENRGHPLFADVGPHFGHFMKRLMKGAVERS